MVLNAGHGNGNGHGCESEWVAVVNIVAAVAAGKMLRVLRSLVGLLVCRSVSLSVCLFACKNSTRQIQLTSCKITRLECQTQLNGTANWASLRLYLAQTLGFYASLTFWFSWEMGPCFKYPLGWHCKHC